MVKNYMIEISHSRHHFSKKNNHLIKVSTKNILFFLKKIPKTTNQIHKYVNVGRALMEANSNKSVMNHLESARYQVKAQTNSMTPSEPQR